MISPLQKFLFLKIEAVLLVFWDRWLIVPTVRWGATAIIAPCVFQLAQFVSNAG